jgi:hypothetical protein
MPDREKKEGREVAIMASLDDGGMGLTDLYYLFYGL